MAEDNGTKETTATRKRRPYEEHAKDAETPAWLVAATAASAGWVQGREVTREDYDKAVDAAKNEVIG